MYGPECGEFVFNQERRDGPDGTGHIQRFSDHTLRARQAEAGPITVSAHLPVAAQNSQGRMDSAAVITNDFRSAFASPLLSMNSISST